MLQDYASFPLEERSAAKENEKAGFLGMKLHQY